MDKARSMPQPQQQYQPLPEQRTPSPREHQSGRMGPPQSHPASMRPGAGPGSSRSGAAATAPTSLRPVPGQPRPMPGQPRGNLAHVAHGPGYGTTSQHRPTLSDGKDDKKDKKKKKLGLF